MLSKADYIKSLPRKIIGCAALFLNDKDELLIVKPTYADGWLVPGGGVDALESPLAGCMREVKEEIGLDIDNLKFVGVEYTSRQPKDFEPYDSLQFMFFGGRLSEVQISQIVLQESELSEWRFVPLEDALKLLRPSLAKHTEAVMALKKKLTGDGAIYIEDKR